MTEGTYDTALICLSGHIVNEAVRRHPEDSREFCARCGLKTISQCPQCKIEIPGVFDDGWGSSHGLWEAPRHCTGCGKPFPWTAETVRCAVELSVDPGGLGEQEAEQLRESLVDLIQDGPRTPLAIERVKRAMAKVGVKAAGAVERVMTNVISETVSRSIWPRE